MMIAEPIGKTATPEVTPEKGEAARLGKVIYERVRADYDTPENKGKALIIDVDTEVCEMVEMQDLPQRLFLLGPSNRRYVLRIGSPTLFRHSNRPRRVVARW